MRLLFSIFFLISFSLPAQKLPVDVFSGKIYYADEVLVKDAPQTDLYNRAKVWFKRIEKENAVLVKDDSANGVLIIHSFFNLTTQLAERAATFKIGYTIKIEVADDKYWYSLYDFKGQEVPKPVKLNAKEQLPINKPLEAILFSENMKAQEKEFYKLLESSLQKQITAHINNLKICML